jgi:hypothetical protein
LGEGGSADATVAQGSAARKRLSNMFPGAPKEEAVSGDANVEQRRSARTKVATALASPQEDTPKKVDVVEATSARPDPTGVQPVPPQGVPQNVTVDVGLPNPIDEPHREDSLNINISPVTLPNLADAQFDSPREEVPMPSNLMDFTQEHWDVMVVSYRFQILNMSTDDNAGNFSVITITFSRVSAWRTVGQTQA